VRGSQLRLAMRRRVESLDNPLRGRTRIHLLVGVGLGYRKTKSYVLRNRGSPPKYISKSRVVATNAACYWKTAFVVSKVDKGKGVTKNIKENDAIKDAFRFFF